MKKIGLVVEGGGMRGIYSSGVLDYFLKHKIHFDYCIGVSAGAGNLATFLAQQQHRNYRFYAVHTKDKRYMGWHSLRHTGSLFGLEFIYNTLTNEIDPIDYPTLMHSRSSLHIPATNAQTGRAEYFSRADLEKYREKIFMASSAVPAICQPIEIDGVDYYDGGIVDPIPVKKAIDDGCDQVVVVLSRARDFIKKPEHLRPAYSMLLRRYPNTVHALQNRHIVYNESLSLVRELEQDGRALVIAPSGHSNVGMLTKDVQALDQLYKMGIADAGAVIESHKNLDGECI